MRCVDHGERQRRVIWGETTYWETRGGGDDGRERERAPDARRVPARASWSRPVTRSPPIAPTCAAPAISGHPPLPPFPRPPIASSLTSPSSDQDTRWRPFRIFLGQQHPVICTPFATNARLPLSGIGHLSERSSLCERKFLSIYREPCWKCVCSVRPVEW